MRRSAWCRQTCDGAWPGVSCTVHGPRSVLDDDARDEVAVGLDDPLDAVAALAGELRPLGQRRDGHAAHARDLQAPRERLARVLRGGRHVRVVGMHPQLAAARVDDVRGLAVVVGVRVRADEQAHVLEVEADLRHRPHELLERALLVQPAVDEHDAVAGGERPGVAVRHARPRQRQPQPPDPRQHALATTELATAGGLGHARGTIVGDYEWPRESATPTARGADRRERRCGMRTTGCSISPQAASSELDAPLVPPSSAPSTAWRRRGHPGVSRRAAERPRRGR